MIGSEFSEAFLDELAEPRIPISWNGSPFTPQIEAPQAGGAIRQSGSNWRNFGSPLFPNDFRDQADRREAGVLLVCNACATGLEASSRRSTAARFPPGTRWP
jgi:hypothetical protein